MCDSKKISEAADEIVMACDAALAVQTDPLAREYTEACKRMWSWLRDYPEHSKLDYIQGHRADEAKYYDIEHCACCAYVTEVGGDIGNNGDCEKLCPLFGYAWFEKNGVTPCEEMPSAYLRWREARVEFNKSRFRKCS